MKKVTIEVSEKDLDLLEDLFSSEITEEQSNFFSLTYKKSHMSLHLKHFFPFK